MLKVRTNIVVEGWPTKLNKKVNGNSLNMYPVIPLLSDEAELISLEISLLCQNKLNRRLSSLDLRELNELEHISVFCLLHELSRLNNIEYLNENIGLD